MPSHIYLALGMWNDVVNSNLAAWNMGVIERKTTGHYDVHALHALQWLSYGYLQLKNYKKAYESVKTMEQIYKKSPNDAMVKWYYSLMRAAYISDTEEWHADLTGVNTTGIDIEISAIASNAYIQGMKVIQDPAKAQHVIDFLHKLSNISIKSNSAIASCYPDTDYFSAINEGGIEIAKIIYFELEAQKAAAQGHLSTAIQFAEQATDIENSISFGYGPPIPVKPANELLAELYLQNQLFVLAYKQFSISLERTANRTISVEGLKEAKRKLQEHHLTIPDTAIKPYFNPLLVNKF